MFQSFYFLYVSSLAGLHSAIGPNSHDAQCSFVNDWLNCTNAAIEESNVRHTSAITQRSSDPSPSRHGSGNVSVPQEAANRLEELSKQQQSPDDSKRKDSHGAVSPAGEEQTPTSSVPCELTAGDKDTSAEVVVTEPKEESPGSSERPRSPSKADAKPDTGTASHADEDKQPAVDVAEAVPAERTDSPSPPPNESHDSFPASPEPEAKPSPAASRASPAPEKSDEPPPTLTSHPPDGVPSPTPSPLGKRQRPDLSPISSPERLKSLETPVQTDVVSAPPRTVANTRPSPGHGRSADPKWNNVRHQGRSLEEDTPQRHWKRRGWYSNNLSGVPSAVRRRR